MAEDQTNRAVMANDVSRTFFEAPVRRKLCVEEESEKGKDLVGLLDMSLNGTRDATANEDPGSGFARLGDEVFMAAIQGGIGNLEDVKDAPVDVGRQMG